MPDQTDEVDALWQEPAGAPAPADEVDALWADTATGPETPATTLVEPDLPANAYSQATAVRLGRGVDTAGNVVPVVAPNIAEERYEADLIAKAPKLRALMGSINVTTQDGLDRHASGLRLAHETGMHFDTAMANLDEILHMRRLAQADPVMWMRANPELTTLLFERPELAPVIRQDAKLNAVSRAWNWMQDHSFENSAFAPPEVREKAQAEKAERDRRRPEALTEDAQAKDVREGSWEILGTGVALPKSVLAPGYRFTEAWAQQKISRSGFELMLARGRGDESAAQDLEARINDQKLDAIRRNYQEGEAGRVLSSMATAAASTAYGLAEGIETGAVGGLVVGAATLAVTKSPAAAGEATVSAGALFGKAGAVKGTFELEAGSAYLSLLEAKDVDGRLIPEQTARTAAAVYGVLATGIEFASWGPMLKAMGPVGELIKNGEVKAVTRAMVSNNAFRAALRRAASNLLPSAVAEGGEEGLQDAVEQAVTLFATGHTVQSIPGKLDTARITESAGEGLIGGFGLGGAAVGVGILSGAMQRDRALAGGKLVEDLLDLSDSPTVRAAPEAVAKLVAKATAAGGAPVESLYVDPGAFLKLFQTQGADANQAITELMGAEGPRLLQEALANGTRLEVPTKDYLEKWGGSETGRALAPDTATSATAPTIRQVEEFDDAVKEAAKDIEKEAATSEGEQAFLDVIEQQLEQVQGEGKGKARTQVNIWRAFVRTMQEKLGTNASEFFRGLTVLVEDADAQNDVNGHPIFGTDILMQRAIAPGMTVEQRTEARAEEFFRDRNTGLLNEEAHKAIPAPAGMLTGHISVEGVKYLNDNLDHETADLLYRAVARELHKLDPGAAKVGGDFRVYVKSQADLDAMLQLVRESLPEQLRGFEITGVADVDYDTAGKKHGAANQERIDRGERAHPRRPHPTLLKEDGTPDVLPPEKPKGLKVDPKDLKFPTEQARAEIPAELKPLVGDLTPEQYFDKAYRDQKTGEWTARGWAALPRKAHVVSIDLKGLRRVNEVFGPEVGDKMLERMGRLAKVLGGVDFDFSHLHGDEYAAQSDDAKALETFVEELDDALAKNPVMFEETEVVDEKTGEPKLTPIPVEFHHGFGERSLEAADADLNDRKSRAKKARAAGLEVRRGRRSGPEGVGRAGGRVDAAGDLQAAPAAEEEVEDRYAAGRAAIGRMRANKVDAQAWLDYVEGKRERPKISPQLERMLGNKYGIVDPLGWPFDEQGRDMRRALGGRKRNNRVNVWDLTGNVRDAYENRKSQPMSRSFFQPGGDQKAGPKNLLVQHNLSTESLLHANELGGFAAPSIAVARKEHPLMDYGEITLLGAPSLVDPATTPVFDADVYSPRYPSTRFKVNRKEFLKIFEWLKPFADMGAGYISDLDDRLDKKGLEAVQDRDVRDPLAVAYLKEKGKPVREEWRGSSKVVDRASVSKAVEGDEAFEKWAVEKLRPAVGDQYIPKHTSGGNVRRIPYTLENVLKEVTKKIRQGEDFNYGLGTARANGAKKFRSLEQIQKARDQITTDAEFRKAKDALDKRFGELAEAMSQYHVTPGGFRVLESLSTAIGESYRRGHWLRRELDLSGFKNVPEELISKVGNLAADLLAMPTTYFEAKPQRAVTLGEFAAAVVPAGTKQAALDALAKHGVRVITYRGGDETSRQEAIQRATEQLELLFAGGDQGKAPRGFTTLNITKEAQKLFKIALSQEANLSTFLHESGHVFLKLLAQTAAEADAPQALKDDWATALKWLGAESFEKLTTEQHEKWARGFERYLMEGNAPSSKLEGAFRAFKLWLKDIYRAVANLNVELNDEIRGVFDRLLATDKEIERQKNKMGFTTPTAQDILKMSPQEYRQYLDDREKATEEAALQAEHTALREKLRETEKWWRDELKNQRKLAEEEYEALPARVAQQTLLGKGEVTGAGKNGEVLLHRDLVVAAVGEKNAKKFKTTTKESEATDPDEIADFLGYPTGKGMLEAVLTLPAKAPWVKARAIEAMAEKHGDILEDRQRMAEVVSKGLHGAMTAKILAREAAAIVTRVPGAVMVPDDVIRAAAKDQVARMRIGKLDAGGALAAERKAADEYAKACAKQNFQRALVMKNRQRLNMYLWREITAARDMREDFLTLAQKMGDRKGRHRLGKGHPLFLGGSDLLLETLQLKEPSPREKPLPSMGEVVAELARTETVGFDPAVLDGVLARGPIDHRSLTVAEMTEVLGALKNIKAAARDRATIVVDGKRIAKEDAKTKLQQAAAGNLPPLPPPPTKGAETPSQFLGGWWNAHDGELRKPEFMLNRLGGRDTNSPWHQFIVRQLQKAKHLEADYFARYGEPVLAALKKLAATGRALEKVDGAALFPGHTKQAAVPQRRFELWVMLLNAGNTSNLERLTLGRSITEEQIRAAAVTVGITDEECDAIQGVIDSFEVVGKESFDLDERDSGLRPEKIEAREWLSPSGKKYRGGYFPAVYDPNVTRVGAQQEAATLFDPGYVRPGTNRSFLKSRVEGFNDVISLSVDTIVRHTAQAIHDLAYRERLKAVANLLLDEDVMQTMRTYLGSGKAAIIPQWLRDIGQMRGTESVRTPKLTGLVRWVRGNLPAVLGYKLRNAVEDYVTNLGTATMGTGLETKHLAAALSTVKLYDRTVMAEAEARSGELRARRGQIQRDLIKKQAELTQYNIPGRKALRFYKDHAFIFQEMADRASATIIFLAAERQYIEKNAEAYEENPDKVARDAATFAEATMRKILPSHSPVDQSALMRDKGPVGAFLVFHGFFNQAYNRVADLVEQAQEAKTAKARAQAIGEALGFMLVISAISGVVRGQGPGAGDEPENEPDPVKRRALKARNYTVRKMLVGAAELHPFTGPLGQVGEAWYLGKKNIGVRNNTVIGIFESIGKGYVKALDDGQDPDVRVKAFLRTLEPTMGVPTGQLTDTGGFLWDWYEGDAQVSDGLGAVPDVLGGVVYGTPRQ